MDNVINNEINMSGYGASITKNGVYNYFGNGFTLKKDYFISTQNDTFSATVLVSTSFLIFFPRFQSAQLLYGLSCESHTCFTARTLVFSERNLVRCIPGGSKTGLEM